MKRRLAFGLAMLLGFCAGRPALAQVVAPSPTDKTPAAADAGAPVPTEQASKGCGKGCTMQSSRSSDAGASLMSLALASLLVARRRVRGS